MQWANDFQEPIFINEFHIWSMHILKRLKFLVNIIITSQSFGKIKIFSVVLLNPSFQESTPTTKWHSA